MNRSRWIYGIALVLAVLCLTAPGTGVDAQEKNNLIPESEITSLQTQLAEANQAGSAARKKLAIRRVIRACEGLLEKNAAAPNRFEVLSVLFSTQQTQISVDDSTTNRRAFLETCRQLAAAPSAYAALRLDADLLLSQTELAKKGADPKARASALKPLVQRYLDTEVEAKVIRIAMLMAIEFGEADLIQHLGEIIAQRMPGNMEMINFQREKLTGQVIGAPFIGTFERGDGKTVQFPMDFLGTTTVLYCWSKENDGVQDLTALAQAWKKAEVELKPACRLQMVSMNMDDLPDAGEGILRELGLDWQALKMPLGQDNPIYQAYIPRDTPTVLIVSPTGYAAIYLSGGRNNRTWERRLQSMMASQWAQSRYASQLQSIFAGEFLVMPSQGDFERAAPPEYKATASRDSAKLGGLPRTAASVPEDKLRAIQACFIDPPLRYRTPHDQVIANYEKADALCRAAIAAHPDADDLWIVRNRRIAALMGLWRVRADQEAFAAAVAEANTAVQGEYPQGTDVVARLCLARQALRAVDADPKAIIKGFIEAAGGQQASGPALTAASLLALDTGDRLLHETYRRMFLDKHADDPTMWTASSFLVERYHRYRLYHPPYGAGWTYGRRLGHFMSTGAPEDAQRTFQAEFKTLEGETVKIPESSNGKWTVISFAPTAAGNGALQRYAGFVTTRPFEDVNRIAAVFDEDADAARKLLEAKKTPDPFPTLLVPDGMDNPLVRKLGILREDTNRPNILILRPDGSIANVLTGLTMSYQKGVVIQNVIELHDEKRVDVAMSKGDLEEAKRLAFAHAPVEQVRPEDAPRHWKPSKLTVPQLRARAKVYLAMGEFEAALADAEQVYLQVNRAAGYISMRTQPLEEIEQLKAHIEARIKQKNAPAR